MFETKKRRRQRLMQTPLPDEWLATVGRHVPYYGILPPEDQAELRGLIQVFLTEKRFEGLAGLEISDTIRLTVAGHACILLLRRETDVYPLLTSILVYPATYFAPVQRRAPGGAVSEGMEPLAGQTWDKGSLVLSWTDVLRSAANMHDGWNVVFHEFAHQLDDEAGVADGAPLLPDASMYADWARVCGSEYKALLRDIEQDRPTLIDSYAAVSPAEFFAVVTELFFEMPVELREDHPELYHLFRKYYVQDPAALLEAEENETQ